MSPKWLPKWSQNEAKMIPWRPLGGFRAPAVFPEPPRRPPGEALGGPKGGLGRKVDRFYPPGASPGGSRRGSGRSFWEHFGCRPCRHEKSKKHKIFDNCEGVFKCRFLFFRRVAGGAGARAHLENSGVRVGRVTNFACRPFSRGTRKQRKLADIVQKRQEMQENDNINQAKTSTIHPQIILTSAQKSSQHHPNIISKSSGLY